MQLLIKVYLFIRFLVLWPYLKVMAVPDCFQLKFCFHPIKLKLALCITLTRIDHQYTFFPLCVCVCLFCFSCVQRRLLMCYLTWQKRTLAFSETLFKWSFSNLHCFEVYRFYCIWLPSPCQKQTAVVFVALFFFFLFFSSVGWGARFLPIVA